MIIQLAYLKVGGKDRKIKWERQNMFLPQYLKATKQVRRA